MMIKYNRNLKSLHFLSKFSSSDSFSTKTNIAVIIETDGIDFVWMYYIHNNSIWVGQGKISNEAIKIRNEV